MHYWPLIVLAFMAGPAFGQAELSTIISPTTFPISPAAGTSAFSVTPTGSPATVVCASGCASAGASPSTVIVSAASTLTVSTPTVVGVTPIGTFPVFVGGTINTSQVSQAVGTAFVVSPSTSPWTINGNVSIGTSPFNVTVEAGSVTATGSPATVVCVAGCSSAGASPSTVVVSAGNVTATGSPASVVLTAQGTVTTSPVAGTIPVSPTGAISIYGNLSASGSPASVIQIAQGTVAISPATGTSAFSVTATGSPASALVANTVTVSPVSATIPVSMTTGLSLASTTVVSLAGTALVSTSALQNVAEQNGNAWPNRANFLAGSLTTSGTGNNVLIKAQGAGIKIYVTSLTCGRTDSATSVFTVGFNTTLSIGTSFNIIVPPTSTTTIAPMTFPTPMPVAANTSLQFTPSTAVAGNSLICNATGFAQP